MRHPLSARPPILLPWSGRTHFLTSCCCRFPWQFSMRLAGFVVVIAAILRFAAFAILHIFIFTTLVGDGPAPRAYSTADESAFAASGKRAYGGTTSSGTTDDFDASVVLMIFL